MKEYNLEINQKVLDEYADYYFEKHPRAKKVPIQHPRHPSLNIWSIMPRVQANCLKQKWLDFITWWVDKNGLSNRQMNRVEMTITTYMPTKRRADLDNMVPKYILDGFVASGMIKDDDYLHIGALTLRAGFDKNYPRTEIYILSDEAEE